jgi:taurine dioxygenase
LGYRTLDVRPVSGALGAEIAGVDLGSDLPDDVFAEIHRAFLEHGVVFFRDQELPPERQIALARRFGPLDVHPIVEGTAEHPEVIRVHKPAGQSASFGTGWHADNTFLPCPSMATLLYAVKVPPHGGDTLFSSMVRAYDALSEPMRGFLDGLRAVHGAGRAYDPKVTGKAKYEGDAPLRYRWSEVIDQEVSHPLVRTHPETGRRAIFVNPMFTLGIEGLAEPEARAILEMLYAHGTKPDFGCRFRWREGSVALWDNRCVWHYALDDYREYERLMFRVTIRGDAPH